VLQRDRVDSVIEMLIKALFNTFNAFHSNPTHSNPSRHQADIKWMVTTKQPVSDRASLGHPPRQWYPMTRFGIGTFEAVHWSAASSIGVDAASC
jgi:hypothetical protein